MSRLELTCLIHADRRVVFDLSRSVELHEVSTSHTNEKAIAGRTTGLLGLGDQVTWRATHFGVSQTLTSKITEFNEPDYFVDEMVHGAFKRFRHEHRFTDNLDGVLVTDVFDYASPLGVLGSLVNALVLDRYLTRFLEQRNAVIKQVAESGRWRALLGPR